MVAGRRVKCLSSIAFLAFVAIVVYHRVPSMSPKESTFIHSQIFLTSAKGNVSYLTINEEVFLPFGFELIQSTVPIPTVRALNPSSCETIFSEWLEVALRDNLPASPPKEVPSDLLSEYTLNHHAFLTKGYRADTLPNPNPLVWDQVSSWLEMDPVNFVTYRGNGGMSVVHSLRFMNITGLSGCVIGSQTPWVEVIALQQGAKHVLTVEYQKTIVEGTDRISYIHPLEYAKTSTELGVHWAINSTNFRRDKFDFIVSYSSIEHSGLQRYGDPPDPIGDLREVQKTRCMLKSGGLFFLGLPRGQDQLVYNAHRVYGRIRLAMVFEGFQLLHVFRNSPNPVGLDVDDFHFTSGGYVQDMFVLKKV